MSEATHEDDDLRPIGAIRLAIGLMQGVLLWLLLEAVQQKVWPATELPLFGALFLLALFLPPILLVGIRELRPVSLVAWAVIASLAIAAVGAHDRWRVADYGGDAVPSFLSMAMLALILFCAHHLVVGAVRERRLIASYPGYFDAAWKHGVQLAASLSFLGAFWLILYMGAGLFDLLKIGLVREVIREDWFAYPASTLVFAGAVHVSDAKPGLIAAIRIVALTLLSWLLPVIAIFAVGFLAALAVVGPEPLWRTGRATVVLIGAIAALVILINAAYRDGMESEQRARILRLAVRVASLAIIPLTALAAYSVWLRIQQYGLTPDRILAAAALAIAAIYGVGYTIAAINPARLKRAFEGANVLAAFAVIGMFLALFTPLLDPAKIAVDDQMRRFNDGTVAVSKFDFKFLRFEGERYGRDALREMQSAQGPEADLIKVRSFAALRLSSRWQDMPDESRDTLAERLTPYPAGTILPESFLTQSWTGQQAMCITSNSRCDAYLIDLNGDGANEIILTDGRTSGVAFAQTEQGWANIGDFRFQALRYDQCQDIFARLRERGPTALAPAWSDFEVDGRRVRLAQPAQDCGSANVTGHDADR